MMGTGLQSKVDNFSIFDKNWPIKLVALLIEVDQRLNTRLRHVFSGQSELLTRRNGRHLSSHHTM